VVHDQSALKRSTELARFRPFQHAGALDFVRRQVSAPVIVHFAGR
jgi:hypothetical protein